MVNRITLFFALSLIWAFSKSVSAQHQHHLGCGTTQQDQEMIKERMFENRRNKAELLAAFDAARANRSANDSTLWVPVVFHMCSRSDGTGQNADSWVLQEMCYFNQNYADQNIQFYLQGINRFNSNQMYTNDEANSDYIRSIHRVNNAVNIYVGGPAVGGTQYGAYYAPNWDWIFTWNDIYNWGLSHEVGHLFTLAHTFNGWEGTDYTTESAASGKAPDMGTNGRPVEKVARGTTGENCQYAADGFCDTPPDYASGGGGCAMPSNWRDPDSVLVTPSSVITNNYMSYFFCTPKSFTQDQKDAIKLDVVRRWNASQPAPNPLNVSGTPTLTWPEQGALAPYTNEPVHFTWTDNGNNGLYLFTVEKTLNNGSLSLGVIAEYVVSGTETWVTLEPNREYKWRVKALTRYELCHNIPTAFSTSAVFNTADWNVSTQSIEASIQNSRVYPNPTSQNSNIVVELEVPFNSDATLTITNMLGQEVMPSSQLNLVAGKNIELINIKDLSKGVYFVNIKSGKTNISHKLMVQ